MTRPVPRSLQEIWRVGCAEEPLSDIEREHFRNLARSRFYTFRLGMEHAQASDDEKRTVSLIAGFVTELNNHPGLEHVWRASEFVWDPAAGDVERSLAERRAGPADDATIH